MRVVALLMMVGLAGAGGFLMKPLPTGATPASAAQGAPTPAPSPAQLKFADTTIPDLHLQPDQTARAQVKVVYEPAAAPEAAAAKSVPAQKGDTNEGKTKDGTHTTGAKSGAAKKGDTTAARAAAEGGNPNLCPPVQPPVQPQVATPVTIKLYLDMDESDGYPACTGTVNSLIGEPSLKPGDPPLPIPISISSCNPKGGKGTLRLSGSKAPGVAVTLYQRRSPWLFAIILGSLIVAVLICVGTGKVASSEGHKLSDMMTQVSWDFSTSWASNITAFGAAFVFLLNLGAGLDKPQLGSKGEYQFIAAFALALAMLAPAVSRLTSATRVVNPPQDDAGQDGKNTQSDPAAVTVGFVRGFLTASVFTIWGTLVQSAGELLIVYELKRAGTLYAPIIIVVGICVGGTAVLLMIYCWKGILSTVAANAMRTGDIAAKPRAMFASDAADDKTIFRWTMSGRKAAVL